MIDEPILITGLPRSGTSLTAGCINLCGAFGGELVKGNRYNPKGFFENLAIREPHVKGVLRKNGFCPQGVKVLPPINYKYSEDPDALREKIKTILIMQGYKPKMKWFFKDVKLTLVWPLWMVAFPKAKWVIVSRSKQSVLESCKNTLFMKNNNLTDDQWNAWYQDSCEHLYEISNHTNAAYIYTDDLVKGNLDQLKSTIEKLGLTYNPKIESFIDGTLWHH